MMAVIVRLGKVGLPKRKGQALANAFERLHEQAALSDHQRRSLRPTGGDVGQNQAVDVAERFASPQCATQSISILPGESRTGL
jgi:hypothetical protein